MQQSLTKFSMKTNHSVQQHQFLLNCATLVEEVHLSIQSALIKVCREFLNDRGMVLSDSTFPGDRFAEASRRCSNFNLYQQHIERELKLATADKRHLNHQHFRDAKFRLAPQAISTARQGTQEASGDSDLQRIRWTMAAIRRRQCAQLARFVRLMGFFELDAFGAAIREHSDLLRECLQRGANAVIIRRLTDRELMASAQRAISKETGNEATVYTSVGQTLHGDGIPTSKGSFVLTKQQVKRLLRSVWEDAMNVLSSKENLESVQATEAMSTKSSALWDESKYEAAFFDALTDRQGGGMELYSAEDILFVATSVVSQALVLQPFTQGDANSLYINIETRDRNEPANAASVAPDASSGSIHERLRSIASVSPTPIFRLQLELQEPKGGNSEVWVNPPLEDLVMAVHNALDAFVEVFKAVSPFRSCPELGAVLRFAEDIHTATLRMDSNTSDSVEASVNQTAVASTLEHSSQQRDSEEAEEGEDGGSRLEERVQDDQVYRLTCARVDELLGNMVHAVTALANCYLHFVHLHIRNRCINFEGKAQQFRQGTYLLKDISSDVLDFREQVRRLENLNLPQYGPNDVTSCCEMLCCRFDVSRILSSPTALNL